jgi:hypothetical protein
MNIVEQIESLLPSYETQLPFSKQNVSFTSFKVKDAKSLALILQEDNKKLALKNMVELLKQYSKGADIESLCLADAEYLFLQIRAKSVDEILNLIYNDEKVQVNIANIEPRNQIGEEEVRVSSKILLILQTPTIKDILRLQSLDKEELQKACIEKIIVEKEIYKINKFVTDEIKQAIDNMPLSVLNKIDSFLKKQPELFVKIQLSNEEKEVSGLLNFFTYR